MSSCSDGKLGGMSFLSSAAFFTTVLGSVPWIDPPRVCCQIADVGPGCVSEWFIWDGFLKKLTHPISFCSAWGKWVWMGSWVLGRAAAGGPQQRNKQVTREYTCCCGSMWDTSPCWGQVGPRGPGNDGNFSSRFLGQVL